MKIFDATTIQELDQYTIAHEPIASIDLMERASGEATHYILQHFTIDESIVVFTGPGNNGGDGLAIARMLIAARYHVEVYVVDEFRGRSPDCKTNLERLAQHLRVDFINDAEDLPELEGKIVIDCLFGSGLNRPVRGFSGEVLQHINSENTSHVIAIDIASGLYANEPNDLGNDIILRPDTTISFQLPKKAFFMPENESFTGNWQVLDIGLDTSFIEQTATDYYLTETADIKATYRPRKKYAHKGSFGHAMIMAGAKGTLGAAVLAVKACLRSGVGLVSAHVPAVGYDVLQTSAPEAMTNTSEASNYINDLPSLDKIKAIGFGPGIGKNEQTGRTLEELISTAKVPLVIDADGLNLLAENKALISQLPEGSILTPHLKEFERLTTVCHNHYERLETLRFFCMEHKLVVVLKGAHTAIGTPQGKVYFNNSGSPAMAAGGSGDVLTGLLTGLLATGQYNTLTAAKLGVWLHGYAGEQVAAYQGNDETLIAGDLIEAFAACFKELAS